MDQAIRYSIDQVMQRIAATQEINEATRRMFEGAAHDPEAPLRDRIEKLKGVGRAQTTIAFFEHVLANLDFDRYRDIQSILLQRDSIDSHRGIVKYLNLNYWLDEKLRIATSLGLNVAEPKSILDIGSGPGHFAYVCRYFGHDVLGMDLPLKGKGAWHGPHVYDALCELFAVRRTTFAIRAFKPLPELDRRFDLVTAIAVKFNANVAEGYAVWDERAWAFLLRDLARNVLSERGQLFMKLNQTGRNASRVQADTELFGFMESNGARVGRATRTVFFETPERFR